MLHKTEYPALEHAKQCFKRSGLTWPTPEEVAAYVSDQAERQRLCAFGAAIRRFNRATKATPSEFLSATQSIGQMGASIPGLAHALKAASYPPKP